MYLGRLNLGKFHLIVVIISTISTSLDVFPPVLVVSVAGKREDAGLERAEDGWNESPPFSGLFSLFP